MRKRILSLALGLCLAISLTAGMSLAAERPTAVIRGYAQKETSNLRVSQLLEVYTTGFAKEAQLEYTYTNKTAVLIGAYSSSNMYAACEEYVLHSKTGTVGDKAFFAVSGAVAQSGTVYVSVKDVNANSATYGKIAAASYGNFAASDIQADMDSVKGGAFVGDTVDFRKVLSAGGVTHVTCFNASLSNCTVTGGSATITSGGIIKLTEQGLVTVQTTLTKLAGCTYHPGTSGTASVTVMAFLKPDVVSGCTSITLTKNLQSGVTYTLNGVSKTSDGTTPLTWSGLTAKTQYPLTLSKGEYSVQMDCATHSMSDVDLTYTTTSTSVTIVGVLEKGITYTLNGVSKTYDGTTPLTWTGLDPNTPYPLTLSKDGNTGTVSGIATLPLMNVTFRLNGVYTLDGKQVTPPPAQKVEYGSTITQTAAADGYDFNGWYANTSGLGNDYRTVGVINDITLYAKWTQRRYLPKVTVTNDGAPYAGRTVQLYRSGRLVGTLTDSGNTGVYTSADKLLYIGSYDVYVNGEKVGTLNADGKKADGATYEAAVTYTTFTVNLKKDDAAYSDQTVALCNQDGVLLRTFTGNGGTYTCSLPIADSSAAYGILVNGVRVKETLGAGTKAATVSYYTATVTAKLDSGLASGYQVSLTSGGAVRYTGTTDSNGAFSAVVYDTGASYAVLISNSKITSGKDVGATVSANGRTAAVQYYTVTFQNGNTTFNAQIVQSGRTVSKPATSPTSTTGAFLGWSAAENGTAATLPATIDATTAYYAMWQTAGVKINGFVRCDAAGVQTPDGQCCTAPNLTVVGYAKVTSAVITVDHGTAALAKGATAYTVSGSGSKRILVKFGGAGVTAAQAAQFLRGTVFTPEKIGENQTHSVTVTVYGSTAS